MNNNKATVNAQNIYLNKLRVDRRKVNMYLCNGIRLYGIVKGFDQFTIVIENNGNQTLVYKNSIISLTPQSPVKPIRDTDVTI